VVSSSPALLATLARQLSVTVPAIERRALALDEAVLDLESFTSACAGHDHQRRRECLFALVGGIPAAALIAESGGEGVNLFGLFNSCRIVPLGDGPPSAAVERALLAAAVDHYRRAGKESFLLFADVEASLELPSSLGFEAISAGLRWIAHRDVVPAWAAYLESLLAAPERAP
jgi:hypothetical protein